MERLGRAIQGELGRFGPQAGMADLVDRWPQVAGEAIARNAWPARIARDGTVHVNTADSIWAFELGQRAAEIAGRLGVPAVRFAAGPLPSAADAPPAPPVVPTAVDEERAHAIASRIDDEQLRETVQRAVSLGLARAARDRRV